MARQYMAGFAAATMAGGHTGYGNTALVQFHHHHSPSEPEQHLHGVGNVLPPAKMRMPGIDSSRPPVGSRNVRRYRMRVSIPHANSAAFPKPMMPARFAPLADRVPDRRRLSAAQDPRADHDKRPHTTRTIELVGGQAHEIDTQAMENPRVACRPPGWHPVCSRAACLRTLRKPLLYPGMTPVIIFASLIDTSTILFSGQHFIQRRQTRTQPRASTGMRSTIQPSRRELRRPLDSRRVRWH